MAVVVGFVALLAAVSLLLAWFVGREVQAITRRRGWSRPRRIAAAAGSFVVVAMAVFYSVVGVLVVALG